MLFVKWIKNSQNGWYSLNEINLSNVNTVGVYIIWHAGMPSNVVRVGQGNIAERLRCHRLDKEVQFYARYGKLYVTWATIHPHFLDGVERHLSEAWKPLVGKRFPDAFRIVVNSPW